LYRIKAILCLSDNARQKLLKRIGTLKEAGKAVANLMAIVEIINTLNAVQAIVNNKDKDKDWELYARLISSFCDVATALGEAKKAANTTGGFKTRVQAGANKPFTQAIKETGKSLEFIGLTGGLIDIGLTLKSMSENIEQGDDAYIGDAVTLTGYTLTTVGILAADASVATLLGFSLATWLNVVGMLVLLIGYLVKRYIFPEKAHLELWLIHGPFGKEKEKRFMGHIHGEDPLKALQTRRRDNRPHGPNFQCSVASHSDPDTHSAYRYAVWCENPAEAYNALIDALYRPTIFAQEFMLNQVSEIRVTITTPFLLNKSKLTIKFHRHEFDWELDGAMHKSQEEDITYEKMEADKATAGRRPLSELTKAWNGYTLSYINHNETKITIKVHLDLYGDGKVVFPYEPAFGGGGTKNADERWINFSTLLRRPSILRDGTRTLKYNDPVSDLPI
jgi:hypothetical protein